LSAKSTEQQVPGIAMNKTPMKVLSSWEISHNSQTERFRIQVDMNFSFVLQCGTPAQSFAAPFNYTLYKAAWLQPGEKNSFCVFCTKHIKWRHNDETVCL
jgi:hypothetical protein